MKKVLKLYKNLGQTPLESIREFQERNPEYKSAKLAYAGRLDPMAEGLLLVLVEDECKNRKEYERLPKEYEFEVLFGVQTDTYDVLGLEDTGLTCHRLKNGLIKTGLTCIITQFIGIRPQSYPPYSAARVNGKPLYYWAREGKLDQIEIPKKEIEVYDLKLLSTHTISSKELEKQIYERVSKVKGNFRQKSIIKTWKNFFLRHQNEFPIARLTISCSSGTYVRGIAHQLGQKLNYGAIAFSIKRTKIGEYTLKDL